MSKNDQIFFEDADATVQQQVVKNISRNYPWSLVVRNNGITGGAPVFTLEVRNEDEEDWAVYKGIEDVAIPADGLSYFDDVLPYEQMRATYDPGGASAGQVSAKLKLKNLVS